MTKEEYFKKGKLINLIGIIGTNFLELLGIVLFLALPVVRVSTMGIVVGDISLFEKGLESQAVSDFCQIGIGLLAIGTCLSAVSMVIKQLTTKELVKNSIFDPKLSEKKVERLKKSANNNAMYIIAGVTFVILVAAGIALIIMGLNDVKGLMKLDSEYSKLVNVGLAGGSIALLILSLFGSLVNVGANAYNYYLVKKVA